MEVDEILQLDQDHVWHPYSGMSTDMPVFPVASAEGVRLKLADGRELIDGMSSWWCAIHGYNHPVLNQAVQEQLKDMSHVMFGGLTHQPAVELAAKLVEITPDTLQSVFFSDSGSVSVEVAMKMAIQYWQAKGRNGEYRSKQKFVSLRQGYHGDTLGAMSVCDPETGMHSLFSEALTKQYFVEAPKCLFGEGCSDGDLVQLKQVLESENENIAALIMEPVVQATGGMRFYSAEYLQQAKILCEENDVLLILDEIATGFGRSGKLFACEHAEIAPDIMCVGKSLTGGYLTLAATLTNREISQTISQHAPGVFMHGPTFMANPLACKVALASIKLLLESSWQEKIKDIEQGLTSGLMPCMQLGHVKEVRVLGAIGVVEMKQAVDMKSIQPQFVEQGIWVRPFGKLIYLMPPYIMNEKDLATLTAGVVKVISNLA
jgi:adenosylmethionine---8-amino-7-oxononanoate aminotransferase